MCIIYNNIVIIISAINISAIVIMHMMVIIRTYKYFM